MDCLHRLFCIPPFLGIVQHPLETVEQMLESNDALLHDCRTILKVKNNMKIFKKDLILEKDTTFNEDIKVEGNNKGYYNLIVKGNINARDINARKINARNIDAWDIDIWDIDVWDINARNINAQNINARDIKAWDIICEKRIKRTEDAKTIARIFIQNRSKLERKEWKV